MCLQACPHMFAATATRAALLAAQEQWQSRGARDISTDGDRALLRHAHAWFKQASFVRLWIGLQGQSCKLRH
jgi:hypothetical protein